MVYLYAGLGVAMLAGIMAIFEMGLTLTGQFLLPSPTDPYFDEANSGVRALDKALIGKLAASVPLGLKGSAICQSVISQLPSYPLSESLVETNVTRWPDACVMNHATHRMVLMPGLPDKGPPYRLYSCVLEESNPICPFERDWGLDG